MMDDGNCIIYSPSETTIKIHKWKVREGYQVANNQVILLYELFESGDTEIKRFKANKSGLVKKRIYNDGDVVKAGEAILKLSACVHTTVIKDMCADCGADLRQEENGNTSEASVPMLHSVPELKVTQKLAQKLGKEDTERLLQDRKLVLLVDLDQTIIHTTNDNVPNNLEGVYHFQLYGSHSPWYHTRLRPGTFEFLNNVSPYFELHICTFGARNYAHTIAQFLDKDGKYFSHRILSRDECFNVTTKTENLKALFPCGDSMVCIIDDREDVWNMAANLIQVKPYHFFQHTGDINAPPGLGKHELDGKGLTFKDAVIDNKPFKPIEKEKDDTIQETITEETENKSDDNKLEENNIDDENPIEITIDQDIVEDKSEQESKTIELSLSTDIDNTLKITNSDEETVKTENIAADKKNLISVEDPDDYLLYLETILKKIHHRFYKYYENNNTIPDLKEMVPAIKKKVLVGKTLVFSGLVPNQVKLEQSRAYLIAKSMGANVTQQLSNETTHLVAVTSGTFKVNAAKKRSDIFVVQPDWLWCCAERWECVDERLFPLDPSKPSKMRQPPAHCHSPEHTVNYSVSNDRNADIDEQDEGPEPKFIDTINPLLKFSNADLAAMNQEFDQFFESNSSSDDEEPVDLENPPIAKNLRKRKREEAKEEAQRKLYQFEKNNDDEIQKINALKDVKDDANADDDDDDDGKDANSNHTSNGDDDDDDEIPSAKFRRGGNLPSDVSDCGSVGSEDPIDEDDDGDWNMMGAALEREFLGLD